MCNLTAIILLCFTFGTGLNASGQNLNTPDFPTNIQQDSFPESWLGNWVGELNIYNANRLVQSLPMELELLPIDTSENYVWAIIYGEDKEAGRRSYELETVDAAKGLYLVDEKNSIKLEAYLFGDKLISHFAVMESRIFCTYEKIGETLVFEIVAGSVDPVSVTGGGNTDEDEIPEVQTFPVAVFQKAVLTRRK